MNLNTFQLRSLKTKVTLFTLVIFLLSIWSLAYFASRMLREDMLHLLGEQQYSTVSYAATEINKGLENRFKALELVARAIDPVLMKNPNDLQEFLDHDLLLHTQFNGGIFALSHDGTSIAITPRSSGEIGVNYMDRDYVVSTLKEGKSTIGRPVIAKALRAPIFSMTMPIRDSRGQVVGALVGVTNLGIPNFLDQVAVSRYGQTGDYVLAAPQHGLNVTATNKNRIMVTLPAPGINPMMDRYRQGYEGTDIFVDPRGVEVLASVKHIPLAGWYLLATLPTEEAFAPIKAMQRRMMAVTFILTLLAGSLTWWMVRRHLSPLLDTLKTLVTLSENDQNPQPLPITSQDEIGQLIGGFNRLLETLRQREEVLKASEFRWKFAVEGSGSSVWDWNIQTNEAKYSKRSNEMLGYGDDGTLPTTQQWVGRIHPDDLPYVTRTLQAYLDGKAEIYIVEYRLRCKDGRYKWILGRGMVVSCSEDGQPLRMIGTHSDITDRKQAEAELRVAAAAFDSQESMVVTNSKGVILRVNRAFTESTGYSIEEAVGENPGLLQSGRHGKAFYRDMWESINNTGGWRGEVWNRRKNGNVYPIWLTISSVKGDDDAVTHYIGTHFDITERKKAEEKINELAFYDQLTGLPNRSLLVDRMKQAISASIRGECFSALLFIDLDNFKTLNDTLGHDMGDLLLKQVAQRLTLSVREGDTVARLGGDEFVVVLVGLSPAESDAATATETIAKKIRTALSQAYRLGDATYHSTASIGATLFGDLAMYKSKSEGRDVLRFFEPTMELAGRERAALEDDLRRALQAEQFLLHYQPQVLHNGRVTGAEVLVRWQHPQRGLVSPMAFIPLAEETGLILPLGHWVLETACTQLAVWATRPAMAHLTLAVNVSAYQFNQSDFVNQVLEILKKTGANPQQLKLELTESLLLHNVQEIIEKMLALRSQGVGFSLDDFGTGYSSLSYLKRLPLDQLKIDQSFVRDVLNDPNDAAIAKTIVALGQSLGLDVIAEGVETEAQRDILASFGCHAYQGYFFSRPLPIECFEKLFGFVAIVESRQK